MLIQPRQQLLDTWRAVVDASLPPGSKDWAWGGRAKQNSISDAEQLLCIMYPAAQVPGFRLSAPDETDDDVLGALVRAGDSVGIPQLLVRVIGEYLHTYVDQSGAPVFSGGSYFAVAPPDAGEPAIAGDLTPDQRALDVVDSYSMSVTLTLNILAFLREFRPSVRREPLLREINDLEKLASRRLTAAMVGLLRSFTVNAFEYDSEPGRVLRRNVNQSGLADRRVVDGLQEALAPVRASLNREVSIGSSGMAESLDNPNLLFECGWSWGVLADAPKEVLGESGTQERGLAPMRPYLYFTGIALDGIEDLFSDRTRILGLLEPQQQRLANALQIRYTHTRQYWATIAMFGQGRWPIEEIPWTTSDGQESDYYSLLVTSIAVQDLVLRRANDDDLRRIYQILSDLATRGRITRRPIRGDEAAVELHSPGVRQTLIGGEQLGPRLGWFVSNFAALLLKRTVRIAELAQSTALRNQLLDLAGQIWDHLQRRRLTSNVARDLWDQTAEVFPGFLTSQPGSEQASWYFTERVVECLVAAADAVSQPPLRSGLLGEYAADLLNEADHLYDRELLYGSTEAGEALRESLTKIRLSLERARRIQHERPGSAVALAADILRDLDRLSAARQDIVGM
jgi:hypothetical protein